MLEGLHSGEMRLGGAAATHLSFHLGMCRTSPAPWPSATALLSPSAQVEQGLRWTKESEHEREGNAALRSCNLQVRGISWLVGMPTCMFCCHFRGFWLHQLLWDALCCLSHMPTGHCMQREAVKLFPHFLLETFSAFVCTLYPVARCHRFVISLEASLPYSSDSLMWNRDKTVHFSSKTSQNIFLSKTVK